MSKDFPSLIVVNESLLKENRQISSFGLVVTCLGNLVHVDVCEQPRHT